MRSGPKVKTTSSDVISSPLWNFTPLRRDSSTVRSSIRFQLSARPGIGSSFDLRLRAIRFSKIGICTRSPTLERSRTTSSEALVATCCTAMVMVGRSSAWPMAKRGNASPPTARPAPATKRRRSMRVMFPPIPLRGLWRIDVTASGQDKSRRESESRHRRLRHILPEVGIVAEKQRGACTFQRLQAIERGQHLLAIVDEARQPAFSQGATEIAGVTGQHDFPFVGPQLER